jgi:hypothetical protein
MLDRNDISFILLLSAIRLESAAQLPAIEKYRYPSVRRIEPQNSGPKKFLFGARILKDQFGNPKLSFKG